MNGDRTVASGSTIEEGDTMLIIRLACPGNGCGTSISRASRTSTYLWTPFPSARAQTALAIR